VEANTTRLDDMRRICCGVLFVAFVLYLSKFKYTQYIVVTIKE